MDYMSSVAVRNLIENNTDSLYEEKVITSLNTWLDDVKIDLVGNKFVDEYYKDLKIKELVSDRCSRAMPKSYEHTCSNYGELCALNDLMSKNICSQMSSKLIDIERDLDFDVTPVDTRSYGKLIFNRDRSLVGINVNSYDVAKSELRHFEKVKECAMFTNVRSIDDFGSDVTKPTNKIPFSIMNYRSEEYTCDEVYVSSKMNNLEQDYKEMKDRHNLRINMFCRMNMANIGCMLIKPIVSIMDTINCRMTSHYEIEKPEDIFENSPSSCSDTIDSLAYTSESEFVDVCVEYTSLISDYYTTTKDRKTTCRCRSTSIGLLKAAILLIKIVSLEQKSNSVVIKLPRYSREKLVRKKIKRKMSQQNFENVTICHKSSDSGYFSMCCLISMYISDSSRRIDNTEEGCLRRVVKDSEGYSVCKADNILIDEKFSPVFYDNENEELINLDDESSSGTISVDSESWSYWMRMYASYHNMTSMECSYAIHLAASIYGCNHTDEPIVELIRMDKCNIVAEPEYMEYGDKFTPNNELVGDIVNKIYYARDACSKWRMVIMKIIRNEDESSRYAERMSSINQDTIFNLVSGDYQMARYKNKIMDRYSIYGYERVVLCMLNLDRNMSRKSMLKSLTSSSYSASKWLCASNLILGYDAIVPKGTRSHILAKRVRMPRNFRKCDYSYKVKIIGDNVEESSVSRLFGSKLKRRAVEEHIRYVEIWKFTSMLSMMSEEYESVFARKNSMDRFVLSVCRLEYDKDNNKLREFFTVNTMLGVISINSVMLLLAVKQLGNSIRKRANRNNGVFKASRFIKRYSKQLICKSRDEYNKVPLEETFIKSDVTIMNRFELECEEGVKVNISCANACLRALIDNRLNMFASDIAEYSSVNDNMQNCVVDNFLTKTEGYLLLSGYVEWVGCGDYMIEKEEEMSIFCVMMVRFGRALNTCLLSNDSAKELVCTGKGLCITGSDVSIPMFKEDTESFCLKIAQSFIESVNVAVKIVD